MIDTGCLTPTLTFSSPSFPARLPLPPNIAFYNAFPELNDVARDRTRSALPQRAKYCLPLDAEFLPFAEPIEAEEMPAIASRMDARTRAQIEAMFARSPESVLPIPREPHYQQVFDLHTTFELAHKRLTATSALWRVRTQVLGPLYTELEAALLQRNTIMVPIIQLSRGSNLQRAATQLTAALRPYVVIEEAASLLIGVIYADLPDIAAWEELWLQDEATAYRHEGDLAAQYQLLQSRFPASAYPDRDHRAEAIVAYVKDQLSLGTPPNAPWLRQRVRTRRVGQELVASPLLTGIIPDVVRTNPQVLLHLPGHPSIAQVIQYLLATDALIRDRGASYLTPHETWQDHVAFNLFWDDEGAYINGGVSASLQEAIGIGLTYPDGTPLDADARYVLALYAVMLESLRQQCGTGVGLRCPLWDGEHCCRFRPLVERAWQCTTPRPFFPGRHWSPPPCLG